MKKSCFCILFILLFLSAAIAGAQTSPKGVRIRLNAGSTTSTSGAYIWSVAVARAINKYASGISVTVIESGGGLDNAKKIREGAFDFTIADSWDTDLEMYQGLETFKGNAWPQIRWFFMRDITLSRTYVRADSGIKTWADMRGKKIGSGNPGSRAAQRVVRFNELLGTGAIIFPGTLGDAVNQLQTGRIDAVHKSGPADDFDAALLEVHFQRPLTVIGFSEEEAAKINSKYPQMGITETPAGSIKPVPKLGPVWEMRYPTGASTSSKISQEVGYLIMKAVYEHWNEIGKSFPSCAPFNPIMDYVKFIPKGGEVPLHAGVVQYAKEIGLAIPPSLIPPEYKGK